MLVVEEITRIHYSGKRDAPHCNEFLTSDLSLKKNGWHYFSRREHLSDDSVKAEETFADRKLRESDHAVYNGNMLDGCADIYIRGDSFILLQRNVTKQHHEWF